MHLRSRAATACAVLLLAAACAQPSPVDPALQAAAAPAPVEALSHHQDFLFVNPGFESGALAPWVVSTGLAPATVPVYPVLQESDLGVTAGGFNFTTVKTGATYSLIPNGLGAADRARYPRFGTRAAMVNEGGNNNNVNKLTQSSVVTTADVDPLDGLVHVRFVVLPVLQNPGHTLRQQPYYYVSITNQTRGTTLASRFNFSNEAGVPWLSTADGTVVYTDWLLFDLPLARSAVSLGDTLVATVIAGGCGLGGHWGQAVVDSFGATIPGLAVYAVGPDSVEAGSDFQYTYRAVNGGGATATGVQLTSNLPAGTTFRSLDTPGVACTTPATGTRGTVSCGLGSLAVGALRTVTVTVRADAAAPSPIRHGWYSVQSTEEQALTGPVVVTQVTTGGTARYVDLVTTLDDGRPGLTWGASTAYALTVTNTGPTTATGARITTNAPAQLTGLAWNCSARLGASCGAASGAGALDTTATLPPGSSVVYAIRASVIAGTGAGQVSFTGSAQAPAGTVERYALDNGAGDDDSLQGGLATVTLTRAGTGAGTLVSSPAGVSCGPGCTSTTGSFAAGSPVTLQAVPAAGSVFAGWSGGTCAGTGPCTFTPAGGEQVTGTFSPEPVRITSALAVTGAVGRPFAYTATAVGTAPVTLGATGLPAWLTFDPLTGRLTGTPPAAGTFTLTLSATDLNASDARTLTITVGVAPVITSALTWTRVGANSSWGGIAVAASGDPTISYVASGFPAGGTLVFNSTTGAFGGAAGSTGVFSIPVVATNAYGSDAEVLVVSVGGAPVITSALTSAGTAAVPWSYTFTATGSGTVTRSVSGLPAWATFNAATGVLSGTPPTAGQFPITLTASNAVGSSVQTLVLTVDGPPVITSALAASATAGSPWSYALTAVGTQPLTRAITGLPAWASYDPASGLLSGTPPAAGTVTFALSASNALGTDARSLVLTVTAPPPPPAPPAITSPLADTALVGVPYSYTLAASGLQPMSFTATGLPAWASFDAATGVLSGTPTATGTVNVTLRAQNGLGSDTRTLELTVAARPAITNALAAFGVVGQPFHFPLTATGTAPLTVGATGLPAGLALVGGALTGTPAAAGVTAVQETAGNPYGTATATLTVTVRAALPAPVILLPAEGGVVGTATPALSGTAPAAEAGNAVRLTEGATVLCTATVGAGGTWSCTPAVALASGPHTVTAVLVDSHGPVGTATDTQAFTVDLAPPPAPTWSGPAAGAHLATATPELSGQAEAGATVTVTRGGQAVCAAVADGAGAWRCTPSAPLPQGPVVLTLVATDAAGNASPGVDRAVTIDTQAPAAPTLEGPPDQAVVASARPALSGHAEAGATVTVTVDGQPACTAVADPGGAWSCTPASDLAEGPHQARAVATDAAGNPSPAATGAFTVDTHPPGAPAVGTVPLDGGAVGGRSPALGGTAEPGATVTVTLDGAVVCTAVADASGAWTCPAVGPLADGEHRLSATATDRAGNASPATAGTFTVRPTTGALQPPAPASTTQNPRLEGTGTPGATIRVYVDGHQAGTTTVGPDGTWTFTLPPQTAGEHTVSIGVVGSDGVEAHGPDQLLAITRPTVDVGGGIGCSQAGQGPSVLGVLAVLALAARSRRRRARAGGGAAALGALALFLLLPAPARAQAVVDGFELEQLALNPAARGGLVVGGGDLLPAGRFRVYAALGYENSPLKYFEDGVLRGTLVEHRWQLAVGGALAVLPWLEVGATVPVVLYQNGASLRSAEGDLLVSPVARGAQLGTPFLQARAAPWREAAGAPLDLGLWLMMGLPLGSSAGLTRDPVMGQVGLGAGRTLGPVRLAAEVGVLLRPEVAVLPGFGAGPGESVGSRLQAGLGLSTLGDGFRAELSARGFLPLTNQPASLELLAGVRVPIGLLELFALGGPGFGNAPGTPVFRLALGVSFGAAAWTPAPPDADGDGVPDASDACPAEAGPADRQGCPAKDADGDGVPDEADACPAQAGPAASQGCPPPPEVAVPLAPAPTPAPAPAPPPPPAAPKVVVAAGRLELQGRVYFDTGRATLQPRSFPLLDEVARVLLAHPEVERVAIDGHTDDQGVPAANQRLSAARAAAVKTYLVAAGVPAGRLQPRGFGQARPLTSNATPEGREQNRRVEFIILGQ